MKECAAGKLHVDLLVVEGAAYLQAPQSAAVASGLPLTEWIRAIARFADYTVAVGTCASFGGLMACGRNPMGATGLQFHRDQQGGLLGAEYRSRAGLPVVNVPGCPAHPDWMIGTLWALRANRLGEADLDRFNRPRAFFGKLAHHACARNEYYEFKASAAAYSQQGCLFRKPRLQGHALRVRLQRTALAGSHRQLHARRVSLSVLHVASFPGRLPAVLPDGQDRRHPHQPAPGRPQGVVRGDKRTFQTGLSRTTATQRSFVQTGLVGREIGRRWSPRQSPLAPSPVWRAIC